MERSAKVRRSVYRGSMTSAQAEEKIARIAKRLALTQVKFAIARDGGSRVGFTVQNARVERACTTQESAEANAACLALWLEDRARNLERGIETFTEAFADSMALALVGSEPSVPVTGDALEEEGKAGARAKYTGTRSVEQSITAFRACLGRLGVRESDVKLTWHEEEHWARLRMRLPSGKVMEKWSRRQLTYAANVAVLALWLQSRTKNWERGIEDVDLDRVFAGNLLPAKVA